MKTLKWLWWIAVSVMLLALTGSGATAQGIIGNWYNAEKDAKIQIYKSGEKYYGKIVWLKNPNDTNGKPKTDVKNTDKKKINEPLMGLLLLKNFKKDNEKEYSGGTVYDPKSGKTYDCNITVKSSTELSIRGYVGMSLFGRTTVWTKAD